MRSSYLVTQSLQDEFIYHATRKAMTGIRPATLARVRAVLGSRLREGERLDRYTSARIGGPADFFVTAFSTEELVQAAQAAWEQQLDLLVLGAGSNLLVSDRGFRGMVIHNRAREVKFREVVDSFIVRAESGMSLPTLARMCVLRGAAGLEWAATVPGSVGGAVVGNAGAHGADTAAVLRVADILQHKGNIQKLTAEDLSLSYRSSRIKAAPGKSVVLAAEFGLERGDPDMLQSKVETFQRYRKQTQPSGASIGSMFRNPPNDYAGRLVESVGLKGARVGGAEISTLHANFFVNKSGARASDVYKLIDLARERVQRETGVELELEIELVGDWGGAC